jgi:hypothetical protein
MCTSAPKIPDPVPPPAPPPPPVKTAKKLENKTLKKRESSKKTGASKLTIRRSTVNTGLSGTGANIAY